MTTRTSILFAPLLLLACGQNAAPPAEQNAAAAEAPAAEKAELPACPFKKTSNWVASLERGKVLVNGTVDLMMAGFKPQLMPRAGAARGVLALELSLVPETGAVVNSNARYEQTGVPPYKRLEVWCGGEQIAGVNMIVVL